MILVVTLQFLYVEYEHPIEGGLGGLQNYIWKKKLRFQYDKLKLSCNSVPPEVGRRATQKKIVKLIPNSPSQLLHYLN